MKKIAVIGAGPAGLSAACQLVRAGYHVDVYEASEHVGGMCRTIDLWGYKVDLGPHRFFSNNKRINNFWMEMAGEDYCLVNRLTRIYYDKKFYSYPIKILEVLKKTGIFHSIAILNSYLTEQINGNKDPQNFEDWVTLKFGKRLFNMFFKTYSEKLWGVKCTDIDVDFAAQRIKQFSFSEAIKNALGLVNSKKHKTLVDAFAYPNLGTGVVYQNMAAEVIKHGGNVFFKRPLIRIKEIRPDGVELEFPDNQIVGYDHVVSSMPLTSLIKGMPEVPAPVMDAVNQLTFRNTILVYLHIDGKDLFPDNWLYIHDSELETGRITNFRNWSDGLYEDKEGTVVVMEYWCNDDDEVWKQSNDEISKRAISEIKKTKLDRGCDILDTHVEKIGKSYPRYLNGYKKVLEPVVDYINSIEALQVIGRYGAFKYNNQDHSILMGLLASENIIKSQNHDLWDVNTDYDSYHEKETLDQAGIH